jgi:hypothetical protein
VWDRENNQARSTAYIGAQPKADGIFLGGGAAACDPDGLIVRAFGSHKIWNPISACAANSRRHSNGKGAPRLPGVSGPCRPRPVRICRLRAMRMKQELDRYGQSRGFA